MFFKKKELVIPTKLTKYPVGSFIETEKGLFYIATDTKRYRIISQRVLDSWNPPRVVTAKESAVGHYRVASKMKFRNGSLLWSMVNGSVYLIVKGERRRIVSPDVYPLLGINLNGSAVPQEATLVSKEELELHPEGEDLA